MKIFLYELILVLTLPIGLFGQTGSNTYSAVDQMIATHPIRFSIFRIQPRLSVGSGYDSNAFGAADVFTASEIGDYYASVSPGGSLAVKFGRRAFIELNEDVTFLYYRDLEQLRDIFNTTSLRFVTGSHKLLLALGGGYLKRKGPINNEFDIPAIQESSSGNAELTLALFRKTDLRFAFDVGQSSYERDENIFTSIPPPPDSRTIGYGAAMEQLVGRKIHFTVEASAGTTEFRAESESENFDPRSDFRRVLTGLVFWGNRLVGRATIGFGQTESTRKEEGAFNDFLINTDVDYKIGRRLAIGFFAQRNRAVSALLRDNFRIYTEGGFRGSIPLSRRFFVDGEFTIGKNDYGNQQVFLQQPVIKDTYRQMDAGFNLILLKSLVLRIGGTHLSRDSNIDLLTKERFTYEIGLSFEPMTTR